MKRRFFPWFLFVLGVGFGMVAFALWGPSTASQPPAPRSIVQVQLGDPNYVPPPPAPDVTVVNERFQEVADLVRKTVVFINVEVPAQAPGRFRTEEEQDSFWQRFQRQRPMVMSAGSGVILSKEGYIVTNNHVVENARSIRVTLSDKREFEAELIGTDPSTDLAVLHIPGADELPVVPLGNSERIQVGEWVMAVGNPFRLTSTVTAGIISAIGRQVRIINDRFPIEDFIQTDAAINPGNSGGALVNLHGQLIGINTAIATESGSYEGYGFAVPTNLMTRVVSDLIAYGEVQRGFLGVQMLPMNAELAERFGMDRIRGVLVREVVANGPADLGGLKERDVILAIQGREVNETNELQSVVAQYHPGETLTLDVLRDAQRHLLEVQLQGLNDAALSAAWLQQQPQQQPPTEDPEEAPLVQPRPEVEIYDANLWGMGLRDLTEADQDAFELTEGAYVGYVRGGSLASQDGLPRDVVITEIEGQVIDSADAARSVLAEAENSAQETVLFRVKRRSGAIAFYELRIPQRD